MILNGTTPIIMDIKRLSVELVDSNQFLILNKNKKNPRPRGRKRNKRKKNVALFYVPKTKVVIGIWIANAPSI